MPARSKRRILFLLTVDTEEEWDWGGPFPSPPFSTRNTSRIPGFHAFSHRLGIRPSYLVDYAICDSAASVGDLQSALALGGCEIGAHLHPWCNPPVEEEVGVTTSHAINLPPPLIKKKLQNLTVKIQEAFGIRPLSFRAGRWGISGWLLRVLSEEGYRIDSSVFPFLADEAFDYGCAPVEPYWPDFADSLAAGRQREILEIPVTSGFNRGNFALCERIHRFLASEPARRLHGVGILWHSGVLRKVSASPELHRSREVRSCIRTHLERGNGLINLFLHSSSLLPGCTPFVKSEADVDRLQRSLAEALDFLASRAEVVPCTLSEAGDLLRASG